MSITGGNILVQAQRLRDLPVLSVVRTHGLELLKSRSSTRRDFAQALKYDQVLSAKILRLVNSVSFGLQKNISDVETALGFLGDHTLQMLFLGSNVFSQADMLPPFCIGDYWLHNYMTAVAAAEIAKSSGKVKASDAFSCGLLHDLGKLALWKSNPEIFKQVLQTQQSQGISFFEAESLLQIPGHHVVGEEVGRAWSLPFVIRKTMRFHHRNVFEVLTLEESVRQTVGCVILANQMVNILKLGCAWGKEEPAVDVLIQKHLGLQASDLARIEKIIIKEKDSIAWLWSETFAAPPILQSK